MKFSICIFLLFLFTGIAARQPDEKPGFIQGIENNRFKVTVTKAFPSGGQTVDLLSNPGFIIIKDSLAQGSLPFFGRAYSVPYGKGGSIEFNHTLQKSKLTVKGKKQHKQWIYTFSVRGEYDLFSIILRITEKGDCSVSVESNQRSPIHYNGKITALSFPASKP